MNVLLSLKPQYAKAILAGKKRYEFRRSIFKQKQVTRAFIYATAPVSKIVGWFEIGGVLVDSPHKIWEKCKKYAGITAEAFFEYYRGCSKAFAIKIRKVQTLLFDPYSKLPNFKPPQSFYYIQGDEFFKKQTILTQLLDKLGLSISRGI